MCECCALCEPCVNCVSPRIGFTCRNSYKPDEARLIVLVALLSPHAAAVIPRASYNTLALSWFHLTRAPRESAISVLHAYYYDRFGGIAFARF